MQGWNRYVLKHTGSDNSDLVLLDSSNSSSSSQFLQPDDVRSQMWRVGRVLAEVFQEVFHQTKWLFPQQQSHLAAHHHLSSTQRNK